jgi:hypothetical protein
MRSHRWYRWFNEVPVLLLLAIVVLVVSSLSGFGAQDFGAWPLPLTLAYAALIVYASLYPFTGWRDQGSGALVLPLGRLAKYWTGFDLGPTWRATCRSASCWR